MTISLDKKKIIKEKIERIKKKKYLIQILEIIQNENNIDTTENNNGTFFYFHNLKNDTYIKLEKYLNNINNENKNSDSEFINVASDTNINDFISADYGSKLKLNNKEKNIIKRKQYEKILSEKD